MLEIPVPDIVLANFVTAVARHAMERISKEFAAGRVEGIEPLVEGKRAIRVREESIEAYVALACDPRAEAERLDAAALEVARAFDLTGMSPRWVLGVNQILTEAIVKGAAQFGFAPGWVESFSEEVKGRTFSLANAVVDFALSGEAAIDAVTDSIASLAISAMTYSDLIIMGMTQLAALEGLDSVAFVRPDEFGTLRYEFLDGDVLWQAYVNGSIPKVTIDPALPSGQGPAGRAWRSAKVQISASISDDQSMAPWARRYSEFGLRSTAAVPVLDSVGRTRAIISLYSAWPSFFGLQRRMCALTQIASFIGLGIDRIGDEGIIEASARRRYTADLNNGRLVMLYQPIIDLRSGKLLRVEALARLRQDSGSLLEPAKFLASFGANELFDLFAQGLEQSMVALEGWSRANIDIGVAINVPSEAVLDQRYIELLVRELERGRLKRGQLTVELTEEEEIRDQAAMVAAVRRLSTLGIAAAQDDLGAGYSSLTRLDKVTFTEVKIDQGLVRRASGAMRSLNLIYHLCQLVGDLGLQVVVEGLESQGLLEVAAILGAQSGQGYAIAKPLSAEAIVDWNRDYKYTVNPDSPVTPLGALALVYRATREMRSAQLHFGPLHGDGAGTNLGHRFNGAYFGAEVELAMETVVHSVSQGLIGDDFFRAAETLSQLLLDIIEGDFAI